MAHNLSSTSPHLCSSNGMSGNDPWLPVLCADSNGSKLVRPVAAPIAGTFRDAV